jgi:hypothetical protein
MPGSIIHKISYDPVPACGRKAERERAHLDQSFSEGPDDLSGAKSSEQVSAVSSSRFRPEEATYEQVYGREDEG